MLKVSVPVLFLYFWTLCLLLAQFASRHIRKEGLSFLRCRAVQWENGDRLASQYSAKKTYGRFHPRTHNSLENSVEFDNATLWINSARVTQNQCCLENRILHDKVTPETRVLLKLPNQLTNQQNRWAICRRKIMMFGWLLKWCGASKMGRCSFEDSPKASIAGRIQSAKKKKEKSGGWDLTAWLFRIYHARIGRTVSMPQQ